ncbi:hypothetical protein AB0H83_12140 [Dactylosporangium sp. NPDC050688]|uniref:hypothetical protein n=1 Tax=Dactylosporangium sp. NPDC050688 TaxID=3157217 RepID=UPI0033F077E1
MAALLATPRPSGAGRATMVRRRRAGRPMARRPLLPSAVFAAEDGTFAVGRDALHLAKTAPDRFEPSPKRCIDDQTVLLGGVEHPVVDLIAAVLTRVVAESRRILDGATPAATLTHPASWGAAPARTARRRRRPGRSDVADGGRRARRSRRVPHRGAPGRRARRRHRPSCTTSAAAPSMRPC